MPGQLYDWTCAACSLEWVKRSIGLIYPSDIYASREQTVYEIGYPEQINSSYGLTNINGPGWALQDVLSRYGVPTEQGWLDFDTTWALAHSTTGMLSGANWYHWSAIRGVQGDTIWIANSAPGYKSVWNNLSRSDWDRLGGWNVVWLR